MFNFFKKQKQDKNENHKLDKMFGDALNDVANSEMEKLTPAQRTEAEEFGKVFSKEFEKLSSSEQEKVWNSFADAQMKQKSKEWHEEWDKKLKEMNVDGGSEKK